MAQICVGMCATIVIPQRGKSHEERKVSMENTRFTKEIWRIISDAVGGLFKPEGQYYSYPTFRLYYRWNKYASYDIGQAYDIMRRRGWTLHELFFDCDCISRLQDERVNYVDRIVCYSLEIGVCLYDTDDTEYKNRHNPKFVRVKLTDSCADVARKISSILKEEQCAVWEGGR